MKTISGGCPNGMTLMPCYQGKHLARSSTSIKDAVESYTNRGTTQPGYTVVSSKKHKL